MTGQKDWWKSKAVTGALAGIIIAAIGYFGWETDLSTGEAVTAAGVIVSNIVSLVGSFRRKETIKKPLPL